MRTSEYGERAMQRMLDNESYFSNIFDTCSVSEHGTAIDFYYGGYKYSLTAWNIIHDPLFDIKHALLRAKDYYEDMKQKKDNK